VVAQGRRGIDDSQNFKLLRAQKSIPRNRLRQPMWPGERYDKQCYRTGPPGNTGWRNRFLGTRFLGSVNV
jgi:hypothetical protein